VKKQRRRVPAKQKGRLMAANGTPTAIAENRSRQWKARYRHELKSFLSEAFIHLSA